MKHIIYKYQIPIDDFFTIKMWRGARILSFQNQNNKPIIWVLCSLHEGIGEQFNKEDDERKFQLIGTGNIFDIPVNEDCSPFSYKDNRYIGTVQIDQFVWHLFEIIERKRNFPFY